MNSLNDINKAVVFIPYAGSENDHGSIPLPSTHKQNRDPEDDDALRLHAYRAAWAKCLDRLKELIQTFHAPIVASIVEEVRTSYSNVLPGLPYSEIPVICITGSTAGSTFLNEIASRLDISTEDDALFDEQLAYTAHLHPADCANVTAGMRAIINGFLEKPRAPETVKRKSTTSLANYDIERLAAWYAASQDDDEQLKIKLVILLHDFEQFDPSIMQDIFYICSLHIPRLPLVFIISLSSPPSPSYLHLTYPRSTLVLMRVRGYNVPSGVKVLEKILLKTFFDVEFEPDIVIGSSSLIFLTEYFNQHSPHLDTAITILQLAHLKHFMANPLAHFVHTTPTVKALSQPSSSQIIDAIRMRLHSSSAEVSPPTYKADRSTHTLTNLVASINAARSEFYTRSRRMRLGFSIFVFVQNFMTRQGYKGLDWDHNPVRSGILGAMINVMAGKLGKDVKFLAAMISKLRSSQFTTFLEELHAFFHSMPSQVRGEEEGARVKIALTLSTITNDSQDTFPEVLESFVSWFIEYLNSELLTPLEEATLWDVWYTGLSPFPSELLNPSVRASVISGLLHPHDYAARPNTPDHSITPSLWELSDTSILFRRYLDSGRMINVYDWFESFQFVLETQRRQHMKQRATNDKALQNSPRKGKAKDEGVTKQQDDENNEERWKFEVQARFMRALHELDYLGFIKHTGRKTDHVMRTVFEILD